MNNYKKNILTTAYALFLQTIKSFKLSYIWGSKMAFFNASQALSPLSGLYGGVKASTIVFLVRSIASLSLSSMGMFAASLLHLPTFFGSFYLASKSKLARVSVPLICIILFLINPIGQQASLYSTYWLIPIAIALLNPQSILLQALGSTFTTHAVGSIIWLYGAKLTAVEWNALISIVWAERLLFALSLTAAYYSIEFSIYIFNKIYNNIAISKRQLSQLN